MNYNELSTEEIENLIFELDAILKERYQYEEFYREQSVSDNDDREF